MLYIHGLRKEKDWKRIIRRIVDIIEKSIEKDVNSDEFHKSRLRIYIDKLKSVCKSKEIIDIDVIYSFTEIIFGLLGGVPDYSRRKVINRRGNYILNRMGTLHYYQSSFQKMWTILEASRFHPFYEYHKHDDLFDVYVTRYNGDPQQFITWYV